MSASSAWETGLGRIVEAVGKLRPRAGSRGSTIDRWQADADAAMFHLRRDDPKPILLAVIGGTGTGKSTLVNRLLDANLTAANFRRTYTAGPVAIGAAPPDHWLNLPHEPADAASLPARGKNDSLVLVRSQHPLLASVVLIDTPDLDGDQPAHHALADRVFRWADAVVFIVSPEKYQMTELLPYYRLAARYAVRSLFVMNKCETPEMLEDYRKLIADAQPAVSLFAVSRDDAAYQPPSGADLATLRNSILALPQTPSPGRRAGLSHRLADLLGRLRDQILEPFRLDRKDIATAVAALSAMETPAPGVDVNPITAQLQRRLQQRSVLYLIGPGRVLDRLRQVPGLLVRLPRTLWDLALKGRWSVPGSQEENSAAANVPDFAATLRDQFTIIQTQIEDVLRSTSSGKRWLAEPADDPPPRIDPADAGKIVTEELDELQAWLQRRWNATPRDTALLLKLLRHLPGGEKLTQWTEAAPYLLAIVVAAHHALFGHVDLMILGGYSLATWLTERLSNEVAARTRHANRLIAERFQRLAHEQIRRSIQWVDSRAPAAAQIDSIERLSEKLSESLEP